MQNQRLTVWGSPAPERKPAIVIVPGIFCVPSHYQPLADALIRAGYRVTIVDLPSNGVDRPAGSKDVETISEAIRADIDAGRNVLLVMHDLGGILGTQATRPKGEPYFFRNDNPLVNKQGMLGLVYIAAWVPIEGRSMLQTIDHRYPFWISPLGDPSERVLWFTGDANQCFFNDCTPEVAAKAARELVFTNEAAALRECKDPAYYGIDSHYLICELDKVLNPTVQALQTHEFGKWRLVERIQAGHAPFLSKTEETAKFIRKCAGENPANGDSV